MKKIVKSLCIVLLLAFVFTASNHVNEVKAATKSEVTYKLKKGTLTISGKGDMPKKMTFERNGKIKKVPLADCAGKLKMVSPDDQLVKAAKRIGISFGE